MPIIASMIKETLSFFANVSLLSFWFFFRNPKKSLRFICFYKNWNPLTKWIHYENGKVAIGSIIYGYATLVYGGNEEIEEDIEYTVDEIDESELEYLNY